MICFCPVDTTHGHQASSVVVWRQVVNGQMQTIRLPVCNAYAAEISLDGRREYSWEKK